MPTKTPRPSGSLPQAALTQPADQGARSPQGDLVGVPLSAVRALVLPEMITQTPPLVGQGEPSSAATPGLPPISTIVASSESIPPEPSPRDAQIIPLESTPESRLAERLVQAWDNLMDYLGLRGELRYPHHLLAHTHLEALCYQTYQSYFHSNIWCLAQFGSVVAKQQNDWDSKVFSHRLAPLVWVHIKWAISCFFICLG